MIGTDVIPFEYEGKPVRVVEVGGDPWFVAADVCAVLGIRDVGQAVERLDEDERGGCLIPTPGGEQTVRCVSEPGMYKLVLRSDKPGAEPFIRHVTHDILPVVRKTGRYEAPNAPKVAEPINDKSATAALNACARTMFEIRKSLGVREAAKAAPALLAKIGIRIDGQNAEILDQLELSLPRKLSSGRPSGSGRVPDDVRIFNAIKAAGEAGISKTHLQSKTQYIPTQERNQILKQLHDSGLIHAKQNPHGYALLYYTT